MPLALENAENTTVDQLGEDGILGLLNASFAAFSTGEGVLGPGDDAAVIPAPRGNFVIATDAMNEGHHFLRQWPCGIADNGYSTGWKLAAQNLSDMNAMGAIPSAVSISLAMPKNTPAVWVRHFANGIATACRKLGAEQTIISGGDLTRADSIATVITATADLVDRPVLRTATEDLTGYRLIHCGNVGLAAAGYAVLSQHELPTLTRADVRAIRGFLRPRPPLDQGPSVAGKVAAMMDVSDSILTDADRLATANGLYAAIDATWTARKAAALAPIAKRYGADAYQWVLTGGEDYGLLAALHPDRQVPQGWDVIGQLTTEPQARPEITGWDHF